MSLLHSGTAESKPICREVRVPKVRLLEIRNTYKWGGGPDKTILLSAEKHNRSLVEPVVAYIRDATDHEFQIGKKARDKRLTYYEIEETGKFDFSVVNRLCEIISDHGINLIHAHDYKTDLFAYLVALKLRKRRPAIISTMHGWAVHGIRGRIYWWMDTWLMRRFDHLIAVSEATKNEMVASHVSGDRITTIHNGIDTEFWYPGKLGSRYRENLGIDPDVPVIGYVGRISPEKEMLGWLRAAARIVQEYPTTQLVVVGQGKDESMVLELKALSLELGIAENLMLLGYREDLPGIYSTFDLFYLNSRIEGICNSLLESMAMGVPVVTTDAGGTRELVVERCDRFYASNWRLRRAFDGDAKACRRQRSSVCNGTGLLEDILKTSFRFVLVSDGLNHSMKTWSKSMNTPFFRSEVDHRQYVWNSRSIKLFAESTCGSACAHANGRAVEAPWT